MPSAKVHDLITAVAIMPVTAFTYRLTTNLDATIMTIAGFLIGGFLLGPDLDTVSRQYLRWGLLKFIWYPYKTVFEHRSCWSHGLIFGPALRVIYLAGITTLISFCLAYLLAAKSDNMQLPTFNHVIIVWKEIAIWLESNFGKHAFFYFFGGIWIGSAFHVFTDAAITFIKTGKVKIML